jgi:hypothetical protein
MAFPQKKSFIVRLAFISAAVLVALVPCLIFLPLPPDGKYHNKFFANGGRAYIKFQKGRAMLIVPGSATLDWGSYTKTNGEWLWQIDPGHSRQLVLHATGVGLRVRPLDGSWSEWYPRLWLSPMPKD